MTVSQIEDDASDDSRPDDDPESLRSADDGLFSLPPDHVVVALRDRTGFAHLGWRRPSSRERLQCAAFLASEQVRRDTLTTAESFAAFGPIGSDERPRAGTLLERVMGGDPRTSTGVQAVSAVLAVEELLSVLYATQAGYLARLAVPGVVGDPTRLAQAPSSALDPDFTSPAEVSEPAVLQAAFQLATAQLGAALCVGAGTAGRRIAEAEDLVDGLPELRDALLDGQIDPRRARILAERTAGLDHADRTSVAHRLIPLAKGCTPLRWTAMVDAVVIAADPAGAEDRRRAAVERRRSHLDRADDGMAKFVAELSAPDAQLAWDVFDAIGQALKGFDQRCIDHRRADAFATMIEMLAAGESVSAARLITLAVQASHETCCDTAAEPHQPQSGTIPPTEDSTETETETESASDIRVAEPETTQGTPTSKRSLESAPDGTGDAWNPDPCSTCGSRAVDSGGGTTWTLPTRQGRRTHLTVVLTLDALAGLVSDPASLLGHGTITADMAEALAKAASTVNLLIGDPETGAVLGASEWVYRPRQHVRDQVVTAYPTCIFTGCDKPALESDLDHCHTFRHGDPTSGGSTTPANMFPTCRLHHRIKTFGGWTYQKRDHTVEFRSPLGLISTTHQIDPVILHGLQPLDPDTSDEPPPF